jgi:hypothetical protein
LRCRLAPMPRTKLDKLVGDVKLAQDAIAEGK